MLLKMSKLFGRRTRRQSLGYRGETLETRAMLAGNVLVSLSGSTLRITGDSADNDVTITEAAGVITVTGNDGTTINGEEELVQDLSEANIRNVRANLGRGNDTADITISETFSVGRDVSIRLGSGNDSLTITGPGAETESIGDDLLIYGSGGNDDITVTDLGIHDDFRVLSGSGDDIVDLADNGIGDDLRISTSRGDDEVYVDDHGNGGNVIGDDLTISTSGGNDFVFVESAVGDDLTIRTGGGHDDVEIVDSAIGDDVFVSTSSGNDLFSAFDNTVGDNAKLYTGSGNDIAEVIGNTVGGNLRGSLGSRADALITGGNTIGGRLSITGSSGRDVLIVDGEDDVNGRVSIRSFATVLEAPIEVDLAATVETDGTITIDALSEIVAELGLDARLAEVLASDAFGFVTTDGTLGAALVDVDNSIVYDAGSVAGPDTVVVEYDTFGITLTVNLTILVTNPVQEA